MNTNNILKDALKDVIQIGSKDDYLNYLEIDKNHKKIERICKMSHAELSSGLEKAVDSIQNDVTENFGYKLLEKRCEILDMNTTNILKYVIKIKSEGDCSNYLKIDQNCKKFQRIDKMSYTELSSGLGKALLSLGDDVKENFGYRLLKNRLKILNKSEQNLRDIKRHTLGRVDCVFKIAIGGMTAALMTVKCIIKLIPALMVTIGYAIAKNAKREGYLWTHWSLQNGWSADAQTIIIKGVFDTCLNVRGALIEPIEQTPNFAVSFLNAFMLLFGGYTYNSTKGQIQNIHEINAKTEGSFIGSYLRINPLNVLTQAQYNEKIRSIFANPSQSKGDSASDVDSNDDKINRGKVVMTEKNSDSDYEIK